MADEAQLAVLKQGADVWNAWRAAHSGTPADLANASLRGLDLARANLAGADCRKADFRGTILSGATLTDANLAGANFLAVTLVLRLERQQHLLQLIALLGLEAGDIDLVHCRM